MKLPKQAQPVVRNATEDIRQNGSATSTQNGGIHPSGKTTLKIKKGDVEVEISHET